MAPVAVVPASAGEVESALIGDGLKESGLAAAVLSREKRHIGIDRKVEAVAQNRKIERKFTGLHALRQHDNPLEEWRFGPHGRIHDPFRKNLFQVNSPIIVFASTTVPF